MDNRLQKNINHPLHKDLGVETISSSNGVGTIVLKLSDYVMNPDGLFHGGIIYLLSDVCAYSGLTSILEEGLTAVTHDIQVSVLRSAKVGDIAKFESKVVHLGKRLSFIEVVASVGEKVIATAKVTKSIVPA